MDVQLSMGLFGAPEVPLLPGMRYVEPIPRPPGWVLYATRRGPIGYHQTRLSGPFGLVVAWCGARGRAVAEDQLKIIPCEECERLFEEF